MTWFDGLLLVLLAAIVVLKARQEAGRALLDTVATLAALWMAATLAPLVTTRLHWQPAPDTSVSPAAFALCFALLLAACLVVSLWLHRQTRWSMEQYDVPISAVFGLVMAVALGHVVADTTVKQALVRSYELPGYLRTSVVAEELRYFHTYHYVVDTLRQASANRG